MKENKKREDIEADNIDWLHWEKEGAKLLNQATKSLNDFTLNLNYLYDFSYLNSWGIASNIRFILLKYE